MADVSCAASTTSQESASPTESLSAVLELHASHTLVADYSQIFGHDYPPNTFDRYHAGNQIADQEKFHATEDPEFQFTLIHYPYGQVKREKYSNKRSRSNATEVNLRFPRNPSRAPVTNIDIQFSLQDQEGKVYPDSSHDVHLKAFPRYGMVKLFKMPHDKLKELLAGSANKLIMVCSVTYHRDPSVPLVRAHKAGGNKREHKNRKATQTHKAMASHSLVEGMRALMTNGLHSDVKIVISSGDNNEKVYPLHKAILAQASPVFAAMFANENVVRTIIKDLDVPIFEKILSYIYTRKVDNVLLEDLPNLVEAANKYGLPEFKQFLIENLISSAELDHLASPERIVDYFLLADSQNLDKLWAASVEYLKAHIKAILNSEKWDKFTKDQLNLSHRALLDLVNTY